MTDYINHIQGTGRHSITYYQLLSLFHKLSLITWRKTPTVKTIWSKTPSLIPFYCSISFKRFILKCHSILKSLAFLVIIPTIKHPLFHNTLISFIKPDKSASDNGYYVNFNPVLAYISMGVRHEIG